MDDWLLAGISGLIAASTLLLGAGIAYAVRVPQPVVAAIMAFGAGVLISALAYELVAEAAEDGGLMPTVSGFLAGALLFVVADWLLSRAGGAHRKRPEGSDGGGSGAVIAVGALIDGVPESIVLGLSVANGGGLSIPIIAAIAISNIPEGLSSTSGMKADGHRAGYVFGVWGGIAGASTVAALLGYALLSGAGNGPIAFVTTVAAGGILAMLSNTMIPEAFQRDKVLTGLFATVGFLTAFVLHELGG